MEMARSTRERVLRFILGVWRLLKFHMVERDLEEDGSIGAWALRQLKIFLVTARSFGPGSEIYLRASALTYNTLLSIVPLLAVAFSLFKAFGGMRNLEMAARQTIVDNLAVGTAEQVSGHLDQIIVNISAGAIGIVGLLVLVYSVVAMMINVENAFNSLWGVRRGRGLAMRLIVYWALVTLSPVLITLSISFTLTIQSSTIISDFLGWTPSMPWISSELLAVFAISLAFTIVFYIMPHTRVRWSAAAMGGFLAGILWHLSKIVYLYLSSSIFRVSAIYGALGVLPIFFIWIYLSWVIVLFGARYSFLYQAGLAWHANASLATATQRYREILALRLCVALTQRLKLRQVPVSVEGLVTMVGAPQSLVIEALAELSKQGLVMEGHLEDKQENAYSLNVDPHEITPGEVVGLVRARLGQDYRLRSDETWEGVNDLLLEAEEAAQVPLRRVPLWELSERAKIEP
jgi:membrane protein